MWIRRTAPLQARHYTCTAFDAARYRGIQPQGLFAILQVEREKRMLRMCLEGLHLHEQLARQSTKRVVQYPNP